jgi:hypothetical protein
VSRFSRRRIFFGGLSVAAVVLTVAAATNVAAAPSRASSRWNHIKASSGPTVAPTDVGSEPQASGPTWKTFHLVEVFSPRFTFVDVVPKGDSPGDYGVFHDPIETTGGVRIGTIDAQCIAAYSDQCSGSIRIPGRGQITFAGITPLGVDPDHYAITGGTGQFAGVGGVLLIEFPFIDAAKLTVTLTH